MVRKLFPTTLFLLTVTTGAALAGPTVVYGDLNIAKPTDAATLAERVHTAAATFCAPTYEARHIIAPAFSAAASSACIKQVSSVALTEIQSMKTGSAQLALR